MLMDELFGIIIKSGMSCRTLVTIRTTYLGTVPESLSTLSPK
jgi:hypothetical protein